MTARILPFPARRRAATIQRIAFAADRYKPASSARYIDAYVRKHAERLRRLGVSETAVERDVAELARALNSRRKVAPLDACR